MNMNTDVDSSILENRFAAVLEHSRDTGRYPSGLASTSYSTRWGPQPASAFR